MLLRETLGAEIFDGLQADPVAFVEAFDRPPWPYQADIMRQVTERNTEGIFTKRIAVVSTPRQNGKSTLSAWTSLWRFFTDPTCEEIISVALDKQSAQIILNDARRIIRKSAVLYDCLGDYGLTRWTIKLKDGRTWSIRSSDAVMSRGLRPSMIAYDELGWTSDDGDLLHVLLSGQAAQVNPLCLITSTVSPIQAGPLWELFEQARGGDPDVRLIYETENKSPLITQKFLDGQRAKLPAVWYAREHMNQWGAGTGQFCTVEQWEKAIEEKAERKAGAAFLFLDLGWKHDESALAISQSNDKTDIIHLEGHKPPKGGTLSLDKLKNRVRELVDEYNVKRVEIESPQGVLMAEQLRIEGVMTTVLHPTSKSNAERWGALLRALTDGTVRLPNDGLLRRQLLSLTIKDSLTGWKVVDVPSVHNDRAVACAGGCFLAQRPAAAHLGKQPKQASKFKDFNGEHPARVGVQDGRSRWDVGGGSKW